MFFRWLKHYMPRSLYGRAALILILPVVLLQVVVSLVLVSRHFEGVTEQMTLAASREVLLVLQAMEVADTTPDALPTVLDALDIELSYPETVATEDTRLWYDFSGIIMMREFRGLLPGVLAVELADDRIVELTLITPEGPMQITFDRNRLSAANSHQLFVNMVLFGILLTSVAYLYLRNQLKPIKRLAAAAEAFGRGHSVPYTPRGAIEVRAAGSAFLDMRARIERQIEQRTLMLSGVSHDLRTPLTRFKLGLSLLEDEDREPLEKDVEEMQRMLDAFLDFARGVYADESEETDPAELVQNVVNGYLRSDADVVMHPTVGAGDVPLRAASVRRAVDNLIGNAIRYGNRAEVSVEITEKYVRIRIEDDGPGIAPENYGEALKPFARLEPARNQNKGMGVGLGLSIAADVARAHGGILRLGESAALGGLRADLVLAR